MDGGMSYSGVVTATRKEMARKFGLGKHQTSNLTSEDMMQLDACADDACRRLLLGKSEQIGEKSMSERITTYCDVCGKQKGETNHWQTVTGLPGNPSFQAFDSLNKRDREDFQFRHTFLLDSCSQGCAMELFQRWLDTGSVLKLKLEASGAATQV